MFKAKSMFRGMVPTIATIIPMSTARTTTAKATLLVPRHGARNGHADWRGSVVAVETRAVSSERDLLADRENEVKARPSDSDQH
jgi:hypothetical protein